MRILNIMSVTVFLVLLASLAARAQVILPAGQTERMASQLVGWFNDENNPNDSAVNVTNTSNTSSVSIHVQFWVSEDGSGVPVQPDGSTDGTCLEVNWCDEFTPNDTHTYETHTSVFRNTDPCLGTSTCGDANEIVNNIDDVGEQGFFTITPVVSCTDRRAIAFNNLTGNVSYDSSETISLNNVGREARSFIDGSLLPDGTILDGITGGYVLIQPEVLMFNFSAFVSNRNTDFGDDNELIDDFTGGSCSATDDCQGFMGDSHVVNIMFSDNYSGPFGDYRSQPSTARFDTLAFDAAEVPTSCNTFTPTCLINQGINDEIIAENDDPPGGELGNILCPGNTLDTGWVRLAVSDIEGLTNVIGLTTLMNEDSSNYAGVVWMVAEGEKEFPTPATPTPTAEPSVTPTPTGDASPEPTGGAQPGGGGGGGSGCAIAGPVQAGTALANMLIVLLPGAAFALRRRFAK